MTEKAAAVQPGTQLNNSHNHRININDQQYVGIQKAISQLFQSSEHYKIYSSVHGERLTTTLLY